MLSKMRTLTAGLVALGIVASAGASEQFVSDCRVLTEAPHRLSGTDEYRRAADHIEERLRSIGVDQVVVQEYRGAVVETKKCEMVVGGGARRIYLVPMRPNGIIPPVTPEGGLAGEILHAGLGTPREFTASPKGRIVVLDYRSSDGWFYAFRQGALAVVFTASDEAQSWQRHSVEADANLPRFFYNGPASDLPVAGEVTIHSEVVWRQAPGRNIFGMIKGTEPALQEEMGQELIILSANLDSYGEVPRISPGARSAANCAGLLKITEHLVRNKPRRNVLIAFFDGQALCHAGSSAFYRALEDKTSLSVYIGKREQSLKYEQNFVIELKRALASGTEALITGAGSSVLARIVFEEPYQFAMVFLAVAAFAAIVWRVNEKLAVLYICGGLAACGLLLLLTAALVETRSEEKARLEAAKVAEANPDQAPLARSGFFTRITIEDPWILTFVLLVVAAPLITEWTKRRTVPLALGAFASGALVVLLPILAASIETEAEAANEFKIDESKGAQIPRRLVTLLKQKAEEHVDSISDLYQAVNTSGELTAEQKEERAAELIGQKTRWNNLRRNLTNESITDEIKPELDRALSEVAADIEVRGKELEFNEKALGSDKALRAISPRTTKVNSSG
jgi:hypothetical protein